MRHDTGAIVYTAKIIDVPSSTGLHTTAHHAPHTTAQQRGATWEWWCFDRHVAKMYRCMCPPRRSSLSLTTTESASFPSLLAACWQGPSSSCALWMNQKGLRIRGISHKAPLPNPSCLMPQAPFLLSNDRRAVVVVMGGGAG
jgi:hypothetical protein